MREMACVRVRVCERERDKDSFSGRLVQNSIFAKDNLKPDLHSSQEWRWNASGLGLEDPGHDSRAQRLGL